jgi:cytochrome P450
MKPVFGPNIVYDAEPSRRNEQMKAMANGLRVSRLQAYVPKIEAEVSALLTIRLSDKPACVSLNSTVVLIDTKRVVVHSTYRRTTDLQQAMVVY